MTSGSRTRPAAPQGRHRRRSAPRRTPIASEWRTSCPACAGCSRSRFPVSLRTPTGPPVLFSSDLVGGFLLRSCRHRLEGFGRSTPSNGLQIKPPRSGGFTVTLRREVGNCPLRPYRLYTTDDSVAVTPPTYNVPVRGHKRYFSGPQNGLTKTRMTMAIMSRVGASFAMR